MRKRALLLIATLVMVVGLAGCGGDDGTAERSRGPATTEGTPEKGGILRIGTINYIDSLNPFNYIESQAYQAMIMIYPAARAVRARVDDGLVIEGDWAESWETSADGMDWTFKLKPGGTWSDGTPLTADDAAWTINTTRQVRGRARPASPPPRSAHVTSAEAADDNTLVIHYERAGRQRPRAARAVLHPPAARLGAARRLGRQGPEDATTPSRTCRSSRRGAYTIKQYEKKGTTVFIPCGGLLRGALERRGGRRSPTSRTRTR